MDALGQYFQRQSEDIHKTWDDFACGLRNGLYDAICDQNQCNDAPVFRTSDERYAYGSPEYEPLRDLWKRVSDGFGERQEVAATRRRTGRKSCMNNTHG